MGGRLSQQEGSFARHQFGSMHGGSQTLHYEVVPGSGSGQLTGITGVLHLHVDGNGSHRYELHYDL